MAETKPDVLILGGGLAGLCLARQLRLAMPKLHIELIEKGPKAIPSATHKVGESAVEGGTHYFGEVLKLREYVQSTHLPKLGLRFFGGSSSSFEKRFEIGAIDFPPVPSAQFDRGVLETDLRALCQADGIRIRTDCNVLDVDITKGTTDHTVVLSTPTGRKALNTRWLVDATGRRRFLQSKLGLRKGSPHKASACWWRLKGERDLSDLGVSHPSWPLRTRQKRWYSTNHVSGHGYWIWIIPLCSGHTSVGIVADERLHPIKQRSTFSLAKNWLSQHEPELGKFLATDKPADFKALKNFAYSTTQAFSTDRWACVGEAAAFTDPLYSMGFDLIAWANTMVCHLIGADQRGQLSSNVVAQYNDTFISFIDGLMEWFRDSYSIFGKDHVTLYKLLWDALHYFSFPARALLHGQLEDPAALEGYWQTAKKMTTLTTRVQQLFRDWATQSARPPIEPGLYHPFVRCPAVRGGVLGAKELERQPPETFREEQKVRLQLMEDLALALLTVAVAEVCPEQISRMRSADAVDPYRVVLDPARWESAQLFGRGRKARPDMIEQMVCFLKPIDPRTEFPQTTQEIREA